MLQAAIGSTIKLAQNLVAVSVCLKLGRVWRRPQTRSRVFQTKKTKAATNPTTTSIQFWTSKPRKVKLSTRNRTAAHPVFRQAKHFCGGNILFLYFYRAWQPCRCPI